MSLRTLVALWTGKLVLWLSRRLGRGGSTLPGRVALRFAPGLLAHLSAQLPGGGLAISGTNGKTTTAKLLAAMCEAAGQRVSHNRAGANLVSGLASALVANADWRGRPRGDVGVFEVDEATMPVAAPALPLRGALVTNFFRDQLDRYGELMHTVELVRRGLNALGGGGVAVLNADDPLVASLAKGHGAPAALYYGLQDELAGLPGASPAGARGGSGEAAPAGLQSGEALQAADAANCVQCGAAYEYRVVFYAHLGHYRCPRCGDSRPDPVVYAGRIYAETATGTRFHLVTPLGGTDIDLHVPGLYNVYNAVAAAAGGVALGLPLAAIKRGLEETGSGFGRMERLVIDGRDVYIALVKNPAGFNQVIRTLAGPGGARHLLLCINDLYADGTDVSWLWDVDFERLTPRQGELATVICSGIRAQDMAVRLKYAGFEPRRLTVEEGLRQALAVALAAVPPGETLHIMPTYTAMLEVREILHKQGHARAFWET